MSTPSTVELMHTLGQQAKTASALMAKAGAATKVRALRVLATLLRANVDALQTENAKDLERARAAGLSEPMVDRQWSNGQNNDVPPSPESPPA